MWLLESGGQPAGGLQRTNHPDGKRKRRNDGKHREIRSLADGFQQVVRGEPAPGGPAEP
jgi:hypothetical protein